MPEQKHTKQPFYRRKPFLWTVGSIVGVIIVVLVAFRVSPWPGAMIIRSVFTKNDIKTSQALEKHQPKAPVASIMDQQYRPNDRDAHLDVYYPQSAQNSQQRLPIIVWTHGGAWVSGGRADNANYYRLLAANGFVVISLDYTLGPNGKYPKAVHQLNDAHRYISEQADRFYGDSSKIFLAGDSAGSQLSSQMAALITNPTYAQELHITPSLQPSQLKGVILNCGIYRMDKLVQPSPTLPKIVGWGTDVSVWAYAGTRGINDPLLDQMSAHYHVTKDFPKTYITGGNADPLTEAQSKPFAAKLTAMGVEVTEKFFPADHKPELPHEYQFNLDNQDGLDALQATVDFVHKNQ